MRDFFLMTRGKSLGTRDAMELTPFRIALARRRLAEYVALTSGFEPYLWQRLLCKRLDRLAGEKGQRILVHKPMQWGGSQILTKRYPARALGLDRTRRIVVAAYSKTQAEKLAGSAVLTARSPVHARIFPGFEWAKASQEEGYFTAERRALADAQASLLTVGLASGYTGSGSDDLIMDDPYPSAAAARSRAINDAAYSFWTETAKGRVGQSGNAVVMFHRYHEDDLAGRLIREGGWEIIRLPAIADDGENDPTHIVNGGYRKPGEALEHHSNGLDWLRAFEAADPFTHAGQMQGVPLPHGGGFLDPDKFREMPEDPRDARVGIVALYFDLASSARQTADHTAWAKTGLHVDGAKFLYDAGQARWGIDSVQREVRRMVAEEQALARTGGYRLVVGFDCRLTQDAIVTLILHDPETGEQHESFRGLDVWRDREPGDKRQRATGLGIALSSLRYHVRRFPQYETLRSVFRAFVGDGKDASDDLADACAGSYNLAAKHGPVKWVLPRRDLDITFRPPDHPSDDLYE